MRTLILVLALVALGITLPAQALSLEVVTSGETWVQSHTPDTGGFHNGVNGSGTISGNEIGGQLRWVDAGGVIGRATLINFDLPALGPNAVAGVRLHLWDTEGGSSNSLMQVGWKTNGPANLATVTFNSLGGSVLGDPDYGFAFTHVLFDPDLTPSDPDVNSGTPQPLPVYEDHLTDLGAALIHHIRDNLGGTVTLVLSPIGDPNHLAVIHGSDSGTNSAFHPRLELIIPEPATCALLGLGALLIARRR